MLDKSWQQVGIHRGYSYPDMGREWFMSGPAFAAELQWISSIARHVEFLTAVKITTDPTLLQDLLADAARFTALRTLQLHCQGGARLGRELKNVGLMRRLSKLELGDWVLADNVSQIQFLCGLIKLQRLHLKNLCIRRVTPAAAETFWRSLANLRHLGILELDADTGSRDTPMPSFSDGLSLLTQLWDSAFHSSIIALTRLSSLTAVWEFQPRAYRPLLQLSGLLELDLMVCAPARPKDLTSFLRELPELIRLTLRGGEYAQEELKLESVGRLLPATPATFPHLRHLALEDLHLSSFLSPAAARMANLTSLKLEGNNFAHLSESISHLTALETLYMTDNPLQLRHIDVSLFSGLLLLKIVDLSRDEGLLGAWTQESREVMQTIEAKLPNLVWVCDLDDDESEDVASEEEAVGGGATDVDDESSLSQLASKMSSAY